MKTVDDRISELRQALASEMAVCEGITGKVLEILEEIQYLELINAQFDRRVGGEHE